MENTLNINENSLDLPLENLFDNDTSDDGGDMKLQSAISQLPVQVPQPVVQPVVQHIPQPIAPSVVSPATTYQVTGSSGQPKGILKNNTPSGQLLQVINNEPVKQLSQLVQNNPTSTVTFSQNPPINSSSNVSKVFTPSTTTSTNITTQNTQPIVAGFNVFGLRISWSTVFVAIGVIFALSVYYYFTRMKKNNPIKLPEKEVSYIEQQKVMEKSNDKKKKKKNKN